MEEFEERFTKSLVNATHPGTLAALSLTVLQWPVLEEVRVSGGRKGVPASAVLKGVLALADIGFLP